MKLNVMQRILNKGREKHKITKENYCGRSLSLISNLENTVNVMLPVFTKMVILIGLILCLSSITIAVYRYLRKKQSLKEIKTYLLYAFGCGVLVIVSGLLVNLIMCFDINFSSCKHSILHSILVGYVISLVVYFIFKRR